MPSPPELRLRPIGIVHSPFGDRQAAPRQSSDSDATGSIELFPRSGIEHALEDLSTFRLIWVLFWFHKNLGWRPKVRPPRSRKRRGVFATRSPYRPNPIGLSAVELLAIEGRILRIKNLDMLDGTPVLDIKPYVAYTDAIADDSGGWLEVAARPPDPGPRYAVEFSEAALIRLQFLEVEQALPLRAPIERALELGPAPHPYRRIKQQDDGFVLAYKEWRFPFEASGERLTVTSVRSGYRPSEVFGSEDPKLRVHRAFLERFGL
jgi:tRNA-Thr(GGU) m(6)t(6)A37 methyltransferase TsaA